LLCLCEGTGRGTTSDDDRMSTYFRAVSRSGRQCPRLRCGEHGSSCAAGTSPVFSTDDAGCPICTCRQLTAFLRPSTSCPPLDCSHLVCVGPVRFSSRLVGHCPVCECVAVDDERAESVETVTTTTTCPELDCSGHFRCHGGRKRDPQTGCETCECNDDDCADCAAVCDSSEPTRCAEECGCDILDRRSCPPLPIDCELRVGCVLGTDANSCEVCRCTETETSSALPSLSVCPQTTCALTCAETGYAEDENGCRLCACASKDAETTTTTTTTHKTTIVVTSTSCAPVDCIAECPAEFDIANDSSGCHVCVCKKSESEPDATKPPCVCSSNGCPDGANCNKSCSCSSVETDRQHDLHNDPTATKCQEMTQDNCDDNCIVAIDDAGCQFCLCDDREPETEAQVTDDRMTTNVMMTTAGDDGDDATSKNTDEPCENLFVCHPICQAVTDSRGCLVECRCDDVMSSLEDVQQGPPEVVADSDSQVMCPTTDNDCSCDVDEEELWTATVDGCLTCVCVTPSTTTDHVLRSTSEYITSTATTTAPPGTSSTTTDTTTTTQTKMSTTSTSITMSSMPPAAGMSQLQIYSCTCTYVTMVQ